MYLVFSRTISLMRPRLSGIQFITCVLAMLLAMVLSMPTSSQSTRAKAPKPKPGEVPKQKDNAVAAAIQTARDAALEQLQQSAEYDRGSAALVAQFDQVIAFGDPSDKVLFRDAAMALRMVELVRPVESAERGELVQFLLRNSDLARSLVFLVQPADKPEAVFTVLAKLRAAREIKLNTYATLTTALCVVHDRPLVRHINENTAAAADVVRLFDYFVANERDMFFGLKNVPTEILIYVVDSTASIDDMAWALNKYAGNRNVGALFFDIEYDYDHLVDGDEKDVNKAGWNLPNILKHGGICADQTYFAMSVGKSIGVPTAYVSGASGEVSHAWVGFLQSDGHNAWWNFNSGRYDAYKGLRGNMTDPQTRLKVPDSTVSLLAGKLSVSELDRQYAAAMTDAAWRLILAPESKRPYLPAKPEGVEVGDARPATSDEALVLLEAGLTACPAHVEGWRVIAYLAESGKLSLDQKKAWEGAAWRLCGEQAPDFYLEVLEPMLKSIPDVNEQNRFWNAAFKRFANTRPDLAASIRMTQAQMWLDAKKPNNAGQCYDDVISRYANAGPFVLEALRQGEQMIRANNGDVQRIVQAYENAWKQLEKPQEMAPEFARQSNYYRVGTLYAQRLDEVGRRADAAKVRAAVDQLKAGN
jgi:hypothetical protein